MSSAFAAPNPNGLFEAKWLMTPPELEKAIGSCEKVSSQKYLQERDFLNRKARVYYIFDDYFNDFIVGLVIFKESYNGQANLEERTRLFTNTQDELERQYGKFTVGKSETGQFINKYKVIDNVQVERDKYKSSSKVRIDHRLRQQDGYIVEDVRIYLFEEGDAQ
jgi:hypothetical protein